MKKIGGYTLWLGTAPRWPSSRARNIFSDKGGTLVVSRKRFFSGNSSSTKVREVRVWLRRFKSQRQWDNSDRGGVMTINRHPEQPLQRCPRARRSCSCVVWTCRRCHCNYTEIRHVWGSVLLSAITHQCCAPLKETINVSCLTVLNISSTRCQLNSIKHIRLYTKKLKISVWSKEKLNILFHIYSF